MEGRLLPIEIKAGATVTPAYFDGLNYFADLSGRKDPAVVVYGGTDKQRWGRATTYPWTKLDEVPLP